MKIKGSKPCPFCGNEDFALIFGENGTFIRAIKCENCLCVLPVYADKISDAVEEWNDRYEAPENQEMHNLLCEMVKIHDQKQEASTSKNDPAFMMALMAQDGAINKARELIAQIDRTEAQS